MGSNSDAGITLVARTDEFEARLKRAVGTFDNLASKGRDVSTSLDNSFKKISIVAKDSVFQIEKSFNSLSIKSDLSLEVQAKALQENVKFFQQQYQKIANDANTSAAEVTRAFTAMNDKVRQITEQPLKSSYSTLKILPTSTIDADKAKIVAAFEQIKTSGTASANDVKRAYAAMNAELDRLNKLGSINPVEKVERGFNLMSIASVAAIVKIQVLYSLVNSTMSLIGSLPSMAMDSVESFNASAISNAALITSMQKGVEDVGKAYQENKVYAEEVQKVLIKMDPLTAASGKNLNDMNQKFMQQGVLIDTNNKKQIDGFLAIANALSALTKNDANANLQYSQEVSALLRGENRPSNKLFQTINALDNGKLAEHLALWKKTAQETGNYGLILEKIGPMLAGFQAAQTDINQLWETQKSTLVTIRDNILRDGFGPEYKLIVKNLTDLNEYLTTHEKEIANFLKSGFEDVNSVIGFIQKYKTELEIVVGSVIAFKTAQLLLNVAAKENPYLILALALATLNGELERSGTSILGVAKKWISAVDDIITKFEGMGVTGKDTVKFLTDAFREFPENVRAFIGLMTVEVAAGFDKAMAYAKAFKDQTKAVFGDSGDTTGYFERVAKEIGIVDKARLDSIDSILKERQTALDSYKAQEKAAADLKKSLEDKSSNTSSGVKVPTGLDFNAVDQEKLDAELRLQGQYQEKLAALNKAENALELADNANKRKLDLQDNQNSYDAKITSLFDYVKKKQSIEVAAAEEDVKTQKDTVAGYQDALNRAYSSGTKGLVDQTAAAIKLDQALLALKNSEANLALIKVKNAGELAKYQRDELDYVKQVQINYDAQNNQFLAAEQLRQTDIEYTTKLWRLQQDAINGVDGAQKALADFKEQGQVSLKLAASKDQNIQADVNASKFGSNNQFDAVVNKYTEMYRKIKEAEDKFGETSIQATNLRMGSMIDSITSGMSTISSVLMKGNKEQFEAGKALAIATAIINGALAVTKAMSTLTYPMNMVVAAMVGAEVGVQIGTIMSQQYQGKANGGNVVAGQTYIVNENRNFEGPEYFTPGVSGVITPARNIKNEDDKKIIPITVNQRISVQGNMDNRTASQVSNDAARKQRIAQVRFG